MTQLHWCKHQAMPCITPRGGVEARPIDLDKKRPSQTVGRLRWRRPWRRHVNAEAVEFMVYNYLP